MRKNIENVVQFHLWKFSIMSIQRTNELNIWTSNICVTIHALIFSNYSIDYRMSLFRSISILHSPHSLYFCVLEKRNVDQMNRFQFGRLPIPSLLPPSFNCGWEKRISNFKSKNPLRQQYIFKTPLAFPSVPTSGKFIIRWAMTFHFWWFFNINIPNIFNLLKSIPIKRQSSS